MDSYVFGVDIGTGSVKIAAVNSSGKCIYSSQIYYSNINSHKSYSEQDARIIFDAFIKIINESLINLKTVPAAISLSSAMHSIMAVDKKGNPLSNLIIWSDNRSAAIADQIKNSKDGPSLYYTTGTPIHSMSPLSKIIWLRRNLPELFQKTFKFISIKEYIWYQLFNEYKIDHSLASATGLFNIETLSWHKPALTLAGIKANQLSQPVKTNYITHLQKQTSSLLNIPANIPFCIGASDGCLANLGTHCLQQNKAVMTIGTSAAIRFTTTKPLRNISIMNFCYILDEEYFVCGAPINNGGNILQWLLKDFLLNKTINESCYIDFFNVIEKVPSGSNGLIFLPYLYGERAPVWDEKSCGVFFGIKPGHSQPFFLRAALEGVCFALKNILTLVEDSSQPVDQINVSGGFVKSALWMQILSNITGKMICIQNTEDASAIGAAHLALKTMNIISNFSDIEEESKKYIYPQKEFEEVYRKYYKVFTTLYPALQDAMHLLYDHNN